MDASTTACVGRMTDEGLMTYMREMAESCLDKWRFGGADEKTDPETSRLLFAFKCVACARVEDGKASPRLRSFVEGIKIGLEEDCPIFDVAVADAIQVMDMSPDIDAIAANPAPARARVPS